MAQTTYQAAYDKAAERLRSQDPGRIRELCGSRGEGNRLVVPYFNGRLAVVLPEVQFDPPGLSRYEQILVLHYLTTPLDPPAAGAVKGEYVSFKNLPGGSFYEPAYRRRGPGRIAAIFGPHPETLLPAGIALGGREEGYRDVSVGLEVFPKVPAVVVLHRGDEEFPPEATILYRDDIINYLPLEDIAVLAGIIAGKLKRAR